MELKVRFTLKNNDNESTFFLVKREEGFSLFSIKHKNFIKLNYKGGLFKLDDDSPFEESEDIIEERLLGLSEAYLEALSQGDDGAFEYNIKDDQDINAKSPIYGPDDIYIENKPFSLRQVVDLIEQGDIDLSPNFQRNFVWDKTRQSKLIESILLGLPLPSIYFSQYNDGTLTVVDGLQRLYTIKKFVNNELVLSNLEYLTECNGKDYKRLSEVLSPLRLRKFGQTQLICFVIDHRSPSRLKFDLFRRLNTGAKPLNNQEIRNCLSKPILQKALYEMSHSHFFVNATGGSLKDTRMEAQETVLRFMYFSEQYSEENPIGAYNGNMDETLDGFVDMLNKRNDFSEFTEKYEEAMKSSYYLFGKYCFRKTVSSTAKRPPINKLLMLCISVLLSQFKFETVKETYRKEELKETLIKLLKDDTTLFQALTWSTNAKDNIFVVMLTLRYKLFMKIFNKA